MLLLMIAGDVSAQRISLTIPSGHASAIQAIATSPNGKYMASGGFKTILIWDVASNKKIHEIQLDISSSRSKIISLSITDKLDKIVACSDEGGIVCHDIQTGKKLFNIGGYISGGGFSKDGSLVYTCDDGSLGIYNATSGKLIKRVYKTVKTSSATGCRFYELPGNQLLITSERGWCIVNLTTDQVVLNKQFEYSSSFRGFGTIEYNPAGNTIIAQNEDSIAIYELNTARVIASKVYMYKPAGFRISSSSRLVVFYNEYKFKEKKPKAFKIDVLQLPGLNKVHTAILPEPDNRELSLYFGDCTAAIPGSKNIVFNDEKDLYFLNTEKGSYEKKFFNRIADMRPFYFDANVTSGISNVLIATSDNAVRRISFETYRPANYVPAMENLVISRDGKLGASIGKKKITIITMATGKPVKTISYPASLENPEVRYYCFHYNNKQLLYTDDKGGLNAIDIAGGVSSRLTVLGDLINFGTSTSSSDGKYFACLTYVSQATWLKVYNLQTKQLVINRLCPCTTEESDKCAVDVTFIPDSHYLYLEQQRNGVLVFNAEEPGYLSAFKTRKDFLNADIMTKEGRLVKAFSSANTTYFEGITFTSDDKIMFTPTTQKGVQVWNTQTRELLGTYYFIEKTNEYIFVSPEGLFDGSVEGMKELYFVKNNKPIPLEKLYERYFTPDLLRRKINGEKFSPPDVAGLLDAPTVSIAYAAAQRNLEVTEDKPTYQNSTGAAEITVTAKAEEGTIDEIRLFHNGKIVTLVTRNLIVEDDHSKTAVKKYTINLLPGQNTIRAVALNTQRTESDPDEIAVVYNAGNNTSHTKPAEKRNGSTVVMIDKNATMHLVVVGINTYKNPKLNLNYALADATAFKEEIEKSAKSVITNIKTYFVTDAAADKAGITSAIDTVRQNAKAQDVFVFYYAGHGVIAESNKEFYLVPNNVSDLKNVDEALKEHGIAAKDLQQYAINIQAQKQLFILDACQSAGAFAEMLSTDGAQQKNIAVVARSTGTHWMAASGAQQFANEFSTLGHGAFTYVLLQALKGEAANDKMITVDGLKDYMQTGVPALMKKYNGSQQTPASYGFGNDFPVEILK